MSSITITFTALGGSSDISIELDEEKNNGKTQFAYGEKAYFKVYADPGINVTVTASDGMLANEGSGQEVIEETLQFIDSNNQTVSKPLLNIVSTQWLGNSLGNVNKKDIKTVTSEKEPQPAGANGIGLLKLKYNTSFRRYSISVPTKEENEYEVLVVAVANG